MEEEEILVFCSFSLLVLSPVGTVLLTTLLQSPGLWLSSSSLAEPMAWGYLGGGFLHPQVMVVRLLKAAAARGLSDGYSPAAHRLPSFPIYQPSFSAPSDPSTRLFGTLRRGNKQSYHSELLLPAGSPQCFSRDPFVSPFAFCL
ncbi:hypothetical protein F4780DRAFT_732061 [Xylariomycetidae sp. FL0641]|nr:hypothetical protein F4780DRAFT_732061 [Xylariomycetidae sp. FL0641]